MFRFFSVFKGIAFFIFCFVLSNLNIFFRTFCFVRIILGFAFVLLLTRWPVLKAQLDP
jgi:hypothetical protein